MKNILLIFLFILSFQSFTKADDIRDFEIEGMSIGDSTLDFFTLEDINNAVDESYEDRQYITKSFISIKSDIYDALQISYKSNDSNKTIVSIVGVSIYKNNIEGCKKIMYEISSQLTNLFPLTIKTDWGKYDNGDNTGHYFPITFYFDDNSTAMVSCHDWHEKTGIDDNLKISLFDKHYSKYIEGR